MKSLNSMINILRKKIILKENPLKPIVIMPLSITTNKYDILMYL